MAQVARLLRGAILAVMHQIVLGPVRDPRSKRGHNLLCAAVGESGCERPDGKQHTINCMFQVEMEGNDV